MATSSDSSEINEAIIKILPQFGVKELKAEQMKILKCMISRDDCLAVLPTGFGKSLPFQMCIPVQRELHINDIGKIIVCCPLVSIMKDQVERLQKIQNLKAVYIGNYKFASARNVQSFGKGSCTCVHLYLSILGFCLFIGGLHLYVLACFYFSGPYSLENGLIVINKY